MCGRRPGAGPRGTPGVRHALDEPGAAAIVERDADAGLGGREAYRCACHGAESIELDERAVGLACVAREWLERCRAEEHDHEQSAE